MSYPMLLQAIPFLCPNCHSNRVNPSRGPFDWLLRMFGRNPYRCLLCSTRFYFANGPLTQDGI
jgi:hypothetical protein